MKPSAPPPPPTPPQRRFSSSIENSQQPAAPFGSARPIDGHPDLLTPSFADPPTMAAARERVHAIARELPRSERFDDETQARPAEEHKVIADRWSPHRRAEMAASQSVGRDGDMDVPYDALPPLNQASDFPPPARPLSDVWNEGNDGDPSTQMRPEDRFGFDDNQQDDDSYDREYRPRKDSYEQERSSYDRRDREESYRPPQDSFEADSFAGYGRNNNDNDSHSDDDFNRRDIRNEDSFSAAPPAQKFGSTAAWPGTSSDPHDTDDSGPRARGQKQPQYDVAAYEAHYPSSKRSDREGDSYRARERASYKRSDERERASYKRSDEGPSQIGYQPTQQANLGDYPMPEPAESSRRERTFAPPARLEQQAREESYRARKVNVQVYDDSPAPQIPPPAAVPREMIMPPAYAPQPAAPAGFVMGVQPIRQNTPPRGGFPVDQFPPAHVVAAPRMGTPNMGVGVPYNHAPSTMAASPRAMGMTPMGGVSGMSAMGGHGHGHQMGLTPMGMAMATPPPAMHVRAASRQHNPSHYAGPVGHQLQMTEVEEAQQGSKVGRFAWFVFGAAFGIFFAFFATGFVPRLGKNKEAEFPPPAPIPVAVQQPQQPQQVQPPPKPAVQPPAPVPVQVQAPPPVVAAAPVAPPQPPQAAPPPQPAPPPPAAAAPAPAPAPAPVAQTTPPAQPKAAPPAAPRGSRAASIARRAAPPPAPPKALPNNTRDDDDDRPAPKKSEKKSSSGDIGDLLNAGLGD